MRAGKGAPAIPTPLNQWSGGAGRLKMMLLVIWPCSHAHLKNGDGVSAGQHCSQFCRCMCIVSAPPLILQDPGKCQLPSVRSPGQTRCWWRGPKPSPSFIIRCMTRKRITFAGEDDEIMRFWARPAICSFMQLQFKCAPAASSGL